MAKAASKIDDVKRPGKVTPPATSRPIIATDGNAPAGDPMLSPADTPKTDTPAGAPALSHTARTIMPLGDKDEADPGSDTARDDESPADTSPTDDKAGDTPDVIKTDVATIEPVKKKTPVPEAKSDITAAGKPATPEAPALEATLSKTPEEDTPAKPLAPSARPKIAPPEPPTADGSGANETSVVQEVPAGTAARDPDAATKAEDAAAAEAKAKRDAELEAMIAAGKYFVPVNAKARRHSHVRSLVLSIVALILTVALVDAVLDVGIVRPPAGVPHTHFFSK